MYSELFDIALHAALEGATVITENRRTSRQLMSSCQQKLGAGRSAWLTPDTLPLDAWLQRTWDDCVLAGHTSLALLRPIQQHALWKNIIMAMKTDTLMDLSGAVAGVQEAWTLLQQYAIELSSSHFQITPETQAFFSWAQEYREHCNRKSWCDFDCLPDRVSELLPKIRPLLPPAVVFYGFDDFTPQQKMLLDALRNAGVKVRLPMPDGANAMSAAASCLALPDAQYEIRAAARWARNLVRSNPQGRIGVVIANMAGLRAEVEHTFSEILHPEGLLVENLTSPRAFDVSLGPALDGYPIVQVALFALQAALGVVSTSDVSTLIRSPYIGGGMAEASSRSCFDLFLRGHAGLEVTVEQIKATFAHPRNHTNCVELRRRVSRLIAVASSMEVSAPPSRWTSTVGNILEAIGWPGTGDGGRPLNSTEYQTTQAWASLLSEFSTLDDFLPSLTANQMLSELKRLAANKLFKPENAGAPVQVMGLLEATGSVFDYLWVCGLSDDVWPPRGHASPFLPLALQRAVNVPHCRPAQDMEFAHRVTQRLSESAPRVVFTWPRHAEDRPLRISPLLAQLPTANLEEIGEPAPQWTDLQKGATGNSYVDDEAPAPDCTVDQPGGTQVFKLQSNCPFRAFVELRLSAKRMDEPELGIRPVDKGKIVEKALEIVWDQLHDQATLQATAAADLDALITSAIDQAMAAELTPVSQEWEKRYRELQRSRIANLLREWLECERRREPFAVVEHQRPVTIAVNGVKVSGRVDRIDRLAADGSLVILDYKSGNGNYSPGQWSGERPQEPQLPLYVLNQDEPVSAVAFAVLRTGECGFKGYGTRKEVLGFSKDNTGRYFAPGGGFEQHIFSWKPVMESLADGYRAGVATVDPKPERVCDYCHVTPLCRRADDRCEPDDEEEKEQSDAE